MNARPPAFTLAAFAGILAITAAPALAQPQSAPPSTPPATGTGATGAGASATATSVPPARARAVQERQDERIAGLRRQLKITPAQDAQWNAFTAVMRDNMTHMRATYAENVDTGHRTALDDMRAYAAITTAHAEDVQKLVPAFAALYAAMSPEQQKTADEVFHQYARREAQRAPARE